MSHTTAGARNPRNLLTSRIPVLLILQVLQVLRKESAFDVVNLTAENIYKNAEPRTLHATVVASKVISRNVVRSQVTSQKTILIERISLLPQVQSIRIMQQQFRYKQTTSMREAFTKNTDLKQYNIQQCNMAA